MTTFWQYQVSAQPVQFTPDPPETITVDKWFRATSIPVRELPPVEPGLFSFGRLPPNFSAQLEWIVQHPAAPPAKPRCAVLDIVAQQTDPTHFGEIITVSKWWQPASLPRWQKPPVEPGTSVFTFHVPLLNVVSVDQWLVVHPMRPPPRPRGNDLGQLYEPLEPTQRSAALLSGTLVLPNLPRWSLPPRPHGGLYSQIDPFQFPEILRLDKWWQAASIPVMRLPPLRQEAWYYSPITDTSTPAIPTPDRRGRVDEAASRRGRADELTTRRGRVDEATGRRGRADQ